MGGSHGHREPQRPGRVRLGQPGPGPWGSQPSHHKTRRGDNGGPTGGLQAPGGVAVEVCEGSRLCGMAEGTSAPKESPSTVRRTCFQIPALPSDLGHMTPPLRASFSPSAKWQ